MNCKSIFWKALLAIIITGFRPDFTNAQQGSNSNAVPFVIPALREWTGSTGVFKWPEPVKLVVDPAYKVSLMPVAVLFAKDLALSTPSLKAEVETGKPVAGAVYFTLQTKSTSNSLPREGYMMEIADRIYITAKDSIGAIWATRSLLQILEQDKASPKIPKGTIRDYPKYAVRGFVLDVGRKFFSLAFLRDYVKFMSYYKMNDFQIHLNDNGFKQFFGDNWDSTYSAFRLENTTYPNLTAKDGSYSKKDFIALQKLGQQYGVNIIPEIDVPAHSLAFSKAVPGIGSNAYGLDHLDLYNSLTYKVIDNVFKEYLGGSNPVFIGKEVHIGTDEYAKKEAEKFRAFTDHYIRLVESYGKKVRMWGALTHAQGKTPVKVDGVTMNLWYNGYAEPKDMFKLGYKGISTPDGWLYIVPAAGYYYDYLDVKKLYQEWTPKMIGKEVFSDNDAHIRGGSFAVWNDHVGNGITEKDVHTRVFPAMQVLSQKMWGGDLTAASMDYPQFANRARAIGEGPGLNMMGRLSGKDSLVFSPKRSGKPESGNHIKALHEVDYNKASHALVLNGQDSYLQTDIPGIGYGFDFGYTVGCWINPKENNPPNAELFSSRDAVVTINQQGSGKLGFTRENYHYNFDYQLPADQWTHITIKGNHKGTSLYVNGILKEKLEGAKRVYPNGKSTAKVQTLFFPLEYIGSKNNAAKAMISDLKVFNIELTDTTISRLASEPRD